MDDANTKPAGRDDDADLMQRAYDTLHGMAIAYLRRERQDHTLQPTALVHEAYLKIARGQSPAGWNSKTHFQAVAATAMRQVLVDYARQRAAHKRGGNWLRVTLTPEVAVDDSPDVDFVALDEAMRELEAMDERKSRVVELRFFGGMTSDEVAAQLGISPKTAGADWYFARAWLRAKLSEPSS